jgi:hypothetical protein
MKNNFFKCMLKRQNIANIANILILCQIHLWENFAVANIVQIVCNIVDHGLPKLPEFLTARHCSVCNKI